MVRTEEGGSNGLKPAKQPVGRLRFLRRPGPEPLIVGEQELRLACENLRGELRRLDTILKMSMAEQRRINSDLSADQQHQAALLKAMDARLDKLQTRLATYTGTVVAMWTIFQILAKTLWP